MGAILKIFGAIIKNIGGNYKNIWGNYKNIWGNLFYFGPMCVSENFTIFYVFHFLFL